MTTTVLPPDVEADVIAYLRAHADVAAGVGGGTDDPNVATTMRGPFPMHQVVGGGGPWNRVQHVASVTLNTWGSPDNDNAETDRVAVKDAHRTALGALLDRAGLRDAGLNISWVLIPAALRWLPDGNQGRFTSSLVFYTRSVS